jgi:hypothetical protein
LHTGISIDAVRVDDDEAVLRLPEDRVQPRDGDHVTGDQVAQNVPRAHRRQLIHVADQKQMAARLDSLEQVIHQQNVHHGGFIHDDHVRVQRVVLVARELDPLRRLDFQQPVDGFSLHPRRLAETFRGATRRRAQQHGTAFGPQQLDDAARDGCFPGAGATREDAHLLRERHPHRRLLLLRQANRIVFLEPNERLVPLHIPEHRQPVARTLL